MTHRASCVDILRCLLTHESPMTRAGICAELSLASQSIDRALTRLLERDLIEEAGAYRNPGTGRQAKTYAPGPLVRVWASRQAGGDE